MTYKAAYDQMQFLEKQHFRVMTAVILIEIKNLGLKYQQLKLLKNRKFKFLIVVKRLNFI